MDCDVCILSLLTCTLYLIGCAANTPTATGQKNESDTLSHGTSEDGGVDEVPHTLSKRDSEGNNFNIKSGSVSTVSCVNIKSGSVSTVSCVTLKFFQYT